jgi:thiamine-monophosphate kinase
VAAEVNAAALPLGQSSGQAAVSLAMALHGGEDYELLFTAPASANLPRKIAGIPITPIGRILRAKPGKPRVSLLTERGSEALEPEGWQHFSSASDYALGRR